MALSNQLINAVIIGDCEGLRNGLAEFISTSDFSNNGDGNAAELQSSDSHLADVKDASGNTLLHLAVLRCLRHRITENQTQIRKSISINSKIFEILLSSPQRKALISSKNKEGQTPLHLFHKLPKTDPSYFVNSTIALIYGTDSSSSKRSNSVEHKNYVDTFYGLVFPQDSTESNTVGRNDVIDLVDNDGFTPLHLAVKNKCLHCIQRLLKCGASFNINSNHVRFPFVTPLIFHQDPWGSTSSVLTSKLNSDITIDDFFEKSETGFDEEFDDNDDTRFGVSFDFCDIVSRSTVDSNKPEREMEFIETFLNADGPFKKQILGHPLVASFVFMKWERVRWMFVWSFIFHIGFAFLFTTYTMSVYLWTCPFTKRTNLTLNSLELRQCDKGLGAFEFSVTLLTGASILGLLELAKIAQNFELYRRQWQNLFQIFMIISMWLSVWPVYWTKCNCLEGWQYSAAAYGIFHVWSTLLINMGRFPKIGVYVEMFGKVLENFGYFMAAYIFLLIAFSISFRVVFPDYPPFATIPRATLKVITMMSGEVDYGDFFYGDHKGPEDPDNLLHPITGHILYGAFVILVTIVLTNLLIGLAVDDIKGLTQNAEFTKTTREIANIAYVESLVFWNALPDISLVKRLRQSIVIARFPKPCPSIEDTQTTGKLQTFKTSIRKVLGALCICRKTSRNADTEGRRSSSCKISLPKYGFCVSLDDCKAPRYFPEDTYFKAVEVIKSHNNASNTNSSLKS